MKKLKKCVLWTINFSEWAFEKIFWSVIWVVVVGIIITLVFAIYKLIKTQPLEFFTAFGIIFISSCIPNAISALKKWASR